MKLNRFFLILVVTFSFFFQKNNQSYIAYSIEDPGKYVLSITEKAINTLTDKSITQEEKEKRRRWKEEESCTE